MSNYTKTTDFEAKDSLPTGDSGKIIRGAEFETEFDAISTAIATKADTAGPTFTGTLTFETISDGTIGVTAFVDEDDMSSNSATLVPTQQSVKAYVDSQVTAQDLDFQADTGGALSIDLDSETLTFTGGTGIDTSGSGNAVTFAIDSTVVTLTGSQTLTNKTLTSPVLNTGVSGTAVLDEDDMASNSATQLATQQSIKAYVDSQVGANNELSEILANGNTTGGTNIVFGDSASVSDDRLVFGDSSDLQIYHSGTHSYIDDAGTGNLTLRGNASVRVEKYEGEILADFAADGAVSLYHDNSVKIATTSTGVSVTGNVAVSGTVDGRDVATDGTKLDGIEAGATGDQTNAEIRAAVEAATDSNVFTDADHSKLDGIEVGADVTDTANVTAAGALMDSELTSEASVKALNQGVATTDSPTFAGLTTTADVSFGDNDKAIFGAGSDLQIYHDGFNSYIDDAGTGDLLIRAENNLFLKRTNSDETYLSGAVNGAVTLFHNNNAKIATTISGIDVTGTVTADGLTVDGTAFVNLTARPTGVPATAGALWSAQTETGNYGIVSRASSTDSFTYIGNTGSSATLGTSYGSSGSYLPLDLQTSDKKRLRIAANGNISFYEDTGTTAKLFWDASAESLGIGTSSPTAGLECINTEGAIVARSTQSSNTNVSLRLAGGAYSGNKATAILLDGVSGENQLYLGGGTSFGEPATDIRFHTGSAGAVGTGTERMRIDSSGNVGIGTSSPSYLLDVSGSAGDVVRFTGDANNSMRAYLGSGYQIFQCVNSGTTNQFGYVAGRFFAQTAGSERMRIDINGNIGIGTSSPQSGFHINTGFGSQLRVQENGGTYWDIAAGGRFDLKNAAGTAIFSVAQSGSPIGTALNIDSSNNVGIGTSSPSGPLDVVASGGAVTVDANGHITSKQSLDLTTAGGRLTGSSNRGVLGQIQIEQTATGVDGGYIRFATSASGSTNPTERMRIDSSGNVGIGTSSPSARLTVGAGASSEEIKVDAGAGWADITLNSDSTNGGHIYFNDGSNAGEIFYYHVSDYMAFNTAGSERMRIDASGNVGIGESSPQGKLHLKKTDTGNSPQNPAGNQLVIENGDSSGSADIQFLSASNGYNHIFFGDAADANVGVLLYDHTSNSMQFTTNTAERMRIDASGNVGIGTDNPNSLSKLQVEDTTASNTSTYISVVSGNAGNAGIAFGDSDSDLVGGVLYNNADNALRFFGKNAFSEAGRFDSSGNFLVGTTDSSVYNNSGSGTGINLQNFGHIAVARDGNDCMVLNRLNSDGAIVNFAKDGTTVGSIGTNSGNIYLSDGARGLAVDGDKVYPTYSTGGDADNAQDLGKTGARWRDLYLSGDVNVTGGKISSYASDSSAPYFADAGNVGIRLSQAGVDDIVPCSSTGADRDNGINFGSAGARWGTIFAATGTINTSDQNEKQDIAELSDAEQRVAVAAKGLLRKFRWKSAVEEKGDDARIHFGIIAQDLQDAFTAEGLDASDYAMWCSDTWIDENTGEERTRMGVRYSELLAFIIAAI